MFTLPKVKGSNLYPYQASRPALSLYSPQSNVHLLHKVGSTWLSLTDTRIRKFFSKVNLWLGLEKNYFTFHSFRRSGATLAYKSHVPVQCIRDHGS